MKRYSFLWVTGAIFIGSFIAHWWFGWLAYVDEETGQGRDPAVYGWLVQMLRETFENWQSEFLQLMWQVAALAFLYYAGSPQSRGDDERIEAKIDVLLRKLAPEQAAALIPELDRMYPGRSPKDIR